MLDDQELDDGRLPPIIWMSPDRTQWWRHYETPPLAERAAVRCVEVCRREASLQMTTVSRSDPNKKYVQYFKDT